MCRSLSEGGVLLGQRPMIHETSTLGGGLVRNNLPGRCLFSSLDFLKSCACDRVRVCSLTEFVSSYSTRMQRTAVLTHLWNAWTSQHNLPSLIVSLRYLLSELKTDFLRLGALGSKSSLSQSCVQVHCSWKSFSAKRSSFYLQCPLACGVTHNNLLCRIKRKIKIKIPHQTP